MKKIFLAFILLSISCFGVGFYNIGDEIPKKWQEQLNIDKYNDDLYVVYMYTPWCSECKKDPEILHKLIDNETNVKGRSICFDKMVDECNDFRKETGLKFFEHNDYSNHFTNRLGITQPRVLLYIKKGIIVFIRESEIWDFELEIKRDIQLNKEPF